MGDLQTDINWYRWAFYFVFGVPFVAWLFLTRSRVWRLAAVLGVVVFVQQSLASRRYIWAFGIGPSAIVTYVALTACVVRGARLPRMGMMSLLWAGFLACAVSGLLVGSFGSGHLVWNVIALQQLYLEGVLMFVLGAIALRGDEDFHRLPALLLALGLTVAVTHLVCIGTGYRFADYPRSMATRSYWFSYGGVFTNVNTLANALLLVIPLSVSVATDRRAAVRLRTLAILALVPMVVSLALTSARGPYGIAVFLIAVTLLVRRGGVGAAVIGALALTVVSAGVYALIVEVFDVAFADLLEDLSLSGLQTDRPQTWLAYLALIVDHPFGIGLAEYNVIPFMNPYDLRHELAHNIYLDIATRIGVLGMLCFTAIVAAVVIPLARARRKALDPRDRMLMQRMLFVIIAYPIGGFIEPIFHNSVKLTHLYFALCGVAFAGAAHVLAKQHAVTISDAAQPINDWASAVPPRIPKQL